MRVRRTDLRTQLLLVESLLLRPLEERRLLLRALLIQLRLVQPLLLSALLLLLLLVPQLRLLRRSQLRTEGGARSVRCAAGRRGRLAALQRPDAVHLFLVAVLRRRASRQRKDSEESHGGVALGVGDGGARAVSLYS